MSDTIQKDPKQYIKNIISYKTNIILNSKQIKLPVNYKPKVAPLLKIIPTSEELPLLKNTMQHL